MKENKGSECPVGHWSMDQVHEDMLVHGGPSSWLGFDHGLTDMRDPHVRERTDLGFRVHGRLGSWNRH